jgi:hypothetical protein
MQPQRKPQGRPRKKRKVKELAQNTQSHAPGPSPPRSWPSDDIQPARDAEAVDLEASSDVESSGVVQDSSDVNDCESDTGDPKTWDPHAGLKPSYLDDVASDGDEVEIEDRPFGRVSEVVDSMVDMLIDLNDDDPRDLEWLPPKQRRRLTARKKGAISSSSRQRVWNTHLIFRKEEVTLPWS